MPGLHESDAGTVSDYDAFLVMLKNAGSGYDVFRRHEYVEVHEGSGWTPRANTATVVRVLPGYRAHFEAEFDEMGNAVSVGQWESM